MASPSRIKDPEQLLTNWLHMNVVIMTLREHELAELLEHERDNKGRLRVMMRLYHRLSRLRSIREKRELAKDAKA